MNIITLANGEQLELNINFLTIKLLNNNQDRLNTIEEDDMVAGFEALGLIIWAILYSNGKKVSEEEALALVPIDEDTIWETIKIFQDKMLAFKKKQESRIGMVKMANK